MMTVHEPDSGMDARHGRVRAQVNIHRLAGIGSPDDRLIARNLSNNPPVFEFVADLHLPYGNPLSLQRETTERKKTGKKSILKYNCCVSKEMRSQPVSSQPHGSVVGVLEPNQVVGMGRYTLLWMLGQGGNCTVWLARDDRLNESVALKFLQPEAHKDARMIAELRKETLRSRRLGHKNIIQLYDLYEASGELPFIIMEYVEGGSLHTLRVEEAQQCLPWAFLRPLTLQLCHALDHAHSEGLVHRDLKPANIMVDPQGHVKLADFGISRAVNDAYIRLLGMRDTRGTLTFMSPQQMDGDPPAPADDIYALGATLYELLTGRAPFFTGDIAHQVRHVPPQPIHACLKELGLNNPIPPQVGSIIMACLRKNPAERPRSIWDVARAIEPEIGNELVVRVRPSLSADPVDAPAMHRYSREFVLVMIVLGLLLILVLVTLYFAVKAGVA